MKAAVFHGPQDVRFEEVPVPELQDGEVLIRVRACGICGSDLHTYRHGMFQEQLGLPLEKGRILGHEFSGEVAEIRGHVEGIRIGDRVTAPSVGANAEYCKVAAQAAPLLVRVPEQVSFEEAATNEPLATSLHAVNLAHPADGETLVIMGAGIIGLGVLQCVKALSAAKTIVVDLSERRLATASQLGADLTVNAAREEVVSRIVELTGSPQISLAGGPLGVVDTVVDCAGAPRDSSGVSVLEQSLLLVKENGKVIVVAAFERPLELELNIIMRKGIHLIGSWAWTPEEFTRAMELLSSGRIDRRPLITHEFPLEKAHEAYETQLAAEAAVKVLLKP
jgi:2-desacetyl-2-hydroxyethyl bacteriochlorophyllide A dehydrogenase